MGEVKLNPDVKALWLARLRSGQDGQCKGQLGDGEGNFCCLGVLSEIAVEQDVIPAAELTTRFAGTEDEQTQLTYNGNFTTLPVGTFAWAFQNGSNYGGMLDNPAVKSPDGHVTSLAELNDDGKTFEEIADIIEEQL